MDILDGRFFEARRDPFTAMDATLPEVMPAKDAYEHFGGYKVTPTKFQARDPKGVIRTTDYRALWIENPKMSEPALVGVVKGRYHPVQPADFVQLWDKHLQVPVLAIGAAGKFGEQFFLVSELEPMTVKDEQIKTYLVGVAPMSGMGSISLRVTPYRPKCYNALQATAARAMMIAHISHTHEGVLEETGAWLRKLQQESEARKNLLEGDFNRMVMKEVNEELTALYAEKVFVMPREPRLVGPEARVAIREKDYETQKTSVLRQRKAFHELVEGRVTGGDSEAMQGNMFRLYNAATEVLQFRRGKDNSHYEGAIFGQRGREIERAYSVALELMK